MGYQLLGESAIKEMKWSESISYLNPTSTYFTKTGPFRPSHFPFIFFEASLATHRLPTHKSLNQCSVAWKNAPCKSNGSFPILPARVQDVCYLVGHDLGMQWQLPRVVAQILSSWLFTLLAFLAGFPILPQKVHNKSLELEFVGFSWATTIWNLAYIGLMDGFSEICDWFHKN